MIHEFDGYMLYIYCLEQVKWRDVVDSWKSRALATLHTKTCVFDTNWLYSLSTAGVNVILPIFGTFFSNDGGAGGGGGGGLLCFTFTAS